MRDFFFSEFGSGEEAVESPEAPGDGAVELDAAVVEAEDGVGADTGWGEGAEAEGDGAGVGVACIIEREFSDWLQPERELRPQQLVLWSRIPHR